MNITIRQLTEDDWFEFSRIRLKSLLTDPKVFGSNYEKESQMTEAEWRSRLQAKDNAIFLIYKDETPIGITCVSVDREDATQKTALLWGSWLAPDFRGKGLSELMYRTRIHWAKRQPTVEKIIVSHRASNTSSKYANQKHGFIATRKIEKVWTDGRTEDEIFYELKIKPCDIIRFSNLKFGECD
ncbi:MAG TPA: GNAT family protein [Pyrinomonadaceae bacterium]|nr:GNAT family protein [Pyrinomonadaceae bacterium]